MTYIIIYRAIAQLSQASLHGVLNIFTMDFDQSLSNNANENPKNLLRLINLRDKESQLLTSKLKIFFVQTSANADILSRHACSIESAARLHPNGSIFVLMRSPYVHLQLGSFKHLRSFSNIHFLHFNETDVYSGTALIRLVQIKRKEFLHYFTISHMSDFLRTALLYKYGGIYFDLDVIPLKSFARFTNAVALESKDAVNVAVLALEKQHLVLDLQMDIQLKSMEKHFHSFCWNCLGPLALTEALKKVCDHEQLHIHRKDKCHQIDIHPSLTFYPIDYQEIHQFFARSSENINYLLTNSSIYSIHYFHHMTMNMPIELLSPFAQIAHLYCPNVSRELIHSHISEHSAKFRLINANVYLICLFLTFVCIFLMILLTQIFVYIRTMRMRRSTQLRKIP